jgi:hypothetical protein
VTADKPNLPLYEAEDPSIVRWYQENQVINVVSLTCSLVQQPSDKYYLQR